MSGGSVGVQLGGLLWFRGIHPAVWTYPEFMDLLAAYPGDWTLGPAGELRTPLPVTEFRGGVIFGQLCPLQAVVFAWEAFAVPRSVDAIIDGRFLPAVDALRILSASDSDLSIKLIPSVRADLLRATRLR